MILDETPAPAKRDGQPGLDCTSCSACCQGMPPKLCADDDASQYKTERIPGMDGLYIKTDANSTCIYLKKNRCSIYEKRPTMCRQYDCRIRALYFEFNGDGVEVGEVPSILQGYERMHTLPKDYAGKWSKQDTGSVQRLIETLHRRLGLPRKPPGLIKKVSDAEIRQLLGQLPGRLAHLYENVLEMVGK